MVNRTVFVAIAFVFFCVGAEAFRNYPRCTRWTYELVEGATEHWKGEGGTCTCDGAMLPRVEMKARIVRELLQKGVSASPDKIIILDIRWMDVKDHNMYWGLDTEWCQ